MMGSMAWHLDELRICDGGDIASDSMETAQDALAKAVEKIISAGSIPIVLGGGHDLAYGHFKGVYNSCKSKASVSQKIGIVNFDAHFDLRPVIKNGNSGTPFYQIAQLCQEQNSKFDYLALGIQKAANTKGLFDKANELKVNYVLSEQINFHNKKELEYRLNEFIAAMDHIYLSIDLDGFSSAFAPGVSAPSPLGFAPDIIWFLMSIIAKSKKLVSVEIVELNPMYDIDNSTSRLAARLIHHLLSQL
jgi:formiminoglutamase